MSRHSGVIAFAGLGAIVGLAVIAVVAGAWWFLNPSESCACAPQHVAIVDGARYRVLGTVNLVNTDGHLAAYAPVTSNRPDAFGEAVAYSLEGVDPATFLVVPNRQSAGAAGAFHELWSTSNPRFPAALCNYMPESRVSGGDSC